VTELYLVSGSPLSGDPISTTVLPGDVFGSSPAGWHDFGAAATVAFVCMLVMVIVLKNSGIDVGKMMSKKK
jgi:hypothetical protein